MLFYNTSITPFTAVRSIDEQLVPRSQYLLLVEENYPSFASRSGQQRSASASASFAQKCMLARLIVRLIERTEIYLDQDLPASRLLTPNESKYMRRLDTMHPCAATAASKPSQSPYETTVNLQIPLFRLYHIRIMAERTAGQSKIIIQESQSFGSDQFSNEYRR
jgi:hypothetical protein